MKKVILLITLLAVFTACNKDKSTPAPAVPEPVVIDYCAKLKLDLVEAKRLDVIYKKNHIDNPTQENWTIKRKNWSTIQSLEWLIQVNKCQ